MEKGTVNYCNSHFEIDEIVLKTRKKTLSNCPTFEQDKRADIESHVDSQGSHPPPQQLFWIISFFYIRSFCVRRLIARFQLNLFIFLIYLRFSFSFSLS